MKQGMIVDDEGTARFYREDMLSCWNGPAVVYKDGTEEYYLYGQQLTKTDWQNAMAEVDDSIAEFKGALDEYEVNLMKTKSRRKKVLLTIGWVVCVVAVNFFYIKKGG